MYDFFLLTDSKCNPYQLWSNKIRVVVVQIIRAPTTPAIVAVAATSGSVLITLETNSYMP